MMMMMAGRVPVLLLLQLQLVAWAAADIVYVTDLTAFSSLAPCAASAVSEVIQGLTQSSCPQGVTALESCACSKDNIPKVVSSSIASSVTYLCSSTATEDIASAAAVYSAYCNQGSPAPAITPAPTLVTQYITDLLAYSQLAPCAESALSDAIFTLTNYLCPSGQSALNSCACTKNQNSLAASERINTEVFNSCGSTHTEDVTSAQAVFAGYCAMGKGTTSFPSPGSISGTVTYYITDLPIFQSLAPCASSAITEVFGSLTGYYGDCQSAPAALASCACLKDQNSAAVSSLFVSSVKDYCSSTDSADVTSAISVLNYYCSAANGQVVPSGVTASVAATGSVSPGGAQTGTGAKPAPTATSPGSKPTAGGSSPDSSSTGSGSGSSSSGSSHGALIGGIAGGVAVVALVAILIIVWVCRRKRHTPAPLASSSINGSPDPAKDGLELHQYSKMPSPPLKPQDGTHEVPAPDYISELGPTGQPAPSQYTKLSSPSQYTKMSSPSMHAVSPVNDAAGLARSGVPEIQGQPGRPNMPEMQGQGGIRPGVPEMYGMSGQPNMPEMQGQGGVRPGVPEMYGTVGRPNVPEMYGTAGQPQNVPEMPGMATSYYAPGQQHAGYGQQGGYQQQQSGYPNQVYEMGQQQQQQGLLPPHAVSRNNSTGSGMGYASGPVYEMYSPDPTPH